ncbi:hypothetical protein GCM10009864_82260 [Streptomyces lunalinharesii]|uniref:Uncharacterized protein n=1 Tax=Streptomyces lunalinharesii TaxID=333384 RepID=A0ABN3T810_9ACTN
MLCTTVGETAVELLNARAGLGLTGVSALMSALLAVVGPVTDARFGPVIDGQCAATRARFGLPEYAPVALLVAGS